MSKELETIGGEATRRELQAYNWLKKYAELAVIDYHTLDKRKIFDDEEYIRYALGKKALDRICRRLLANIPGLEVKDWDGTTYTRMRDSDEVKVTLPIKKTEEDEDAYTAGYNDANEAARYEEDER